MLRGGGAWGEAMRTRTSGLTAIGVAVLLASCGGSERTREPPPVPVSPNGEPLVLAIPGTVGALSCDEALARWFDEADTNHDGRLDPAEFLADAQRWFTTMDSNHDGSVTPDELTQLRLKLTPPTVRTARDTAIERTDERRRGRGWFAGEPTRIAADRPDPVMSADLNLDNRVTWEEFKAQSERTFAGLDRNRDGRLGKDEVAIGCQNQKK